jgi:hypothetical protein
VPSAVVIRFPVERVRRAKRRGAQVFKALGDGARLEREANRLTSACALVTFAIAAVLQVAIG